MSECREMEILNEFYNIEYNWLTKHAFPIAPPAGSSKYLEIYNLHSRLTSIFLEAINLKQKIQSLETGDDINSM
jgi:hypothetical protein